MPGLISPTDQEKLRETFSLITRRVHLLFFTQTLDCETCLQARQIVDELPLLSDRVVIDEVNFVLEKDKARQFGIDRVPAIAVTFDDDAGAQQDTRIRFLGTPAGYEFMSLVQAVLVAGGRPSSLSAATLARLAALDQPVAMQVFTTPT
jgi:alkyl hydroperoxide reductase subunit AhpF